MSNYITVQHNQLAGATYRPVADTALESSNSVTDASQPSSQLPSTHPSGAANSRASPNAEVSPQDASAAAQSIQNVMQRQMMIQQQQAGMINASQYKAETDRLYRALPLRMRNEIDKQVGEVPEEARDETRGGIVRQAELWRINPDASFLWAVKKNNLALASVLHEEFHANIDIADEDGNSALHWSMLTLSACVCNGLQCLSYC